MRVPSGCLAVLVTLVAAHAPAQAQKTPAPPRETQAAFDGFIATFRAALKADDAAAVAGMVRLPFMGDKAYSDAAQFRAKAYPNVFNAKTRACLQTRKAAYDRDGENNDAFHVFCGQNIFTFTKTSSGFLLTDVDAND